VQTPSGKQSIANQTIEAENAADMAASAFQLRNIRSTNVMIVHDRLETTIGSAIFRTSFPPAGRRHQEASMSPSNSIPFIAGLHNWWLHSTAFLSGQLPSH